MGKEEFSLSKIKLFWSTTVPASHHHIIHNKAICAQEMKITIRNRKKHKYPLKCIRTSLLLGFMRLLSPTEIHNFQGWSISRFKVSKSDDSLQFWGFIVPIFIISKGFTITRVHNFLDLSMWWFKVARINDFNSSPFCGLTVLQVIKYH